MAVLFLAAWMLVNPLPRARAQLVVVAVPSVKVVQKADQYLTKFTGQAPNALIEDLLKKLSGDKKETGLDPERPLGLYVEARKLDLVGFVPVVDEEKFLKTLRALKFTLAKPQQGIHRVTEPFLKTRLFLRFWKTTAYLAPESAPLKDTKRLLDPKTFVPSTAPGEVLVAQFNVGQIPKEFKKGLLKALGQKDEREPGESQLLYRTKLAFFKSYQALLAGILEEIQKVVFKLEMDPRKHNIALDLAVVPRPKSKLIPAFQSFGRTRSRFQQLAPGSVVSLCARLPLPRGLGSVFQNAILDQIEQTANPQDRVVARRVFKALSPTFAAEEVDVALAFRKPRRGGQAGLVAGFRVQKGRQLEHILRDDIKGTARSERLEFAVQWKHSRRGKALIHKISIPTPGGEATVFLATGPEVILAASNEALIKEALDGLGQDSSFVEAPVQLDGNLDSIFGVYVVGNLATKNEALAMSLYEVVLEGRGDKIEAYLIKAFTQAGWKKLVKDFYKVFREEEIQKARFRLSLQGGEAIHLRLDVSSLLLKLLED
jgi:hypothetical protein